MSSKVVVLENLLKQHKYYNVTELKEKLNIDDEQLIVLISKIIDDNIMHFDDYLSFDDYKNLYKCFYYLNELISKNVNVEDSTVLPHLKKIYNRLEEAINKYEEKKKQGIYSSNEFVIDEIKDIVEKIIQNCNSSECLIIDDKKRSVYQFLKYLIFNVKKFHYIEEIFEKIPDLVNIKENDVMLFDELINEYINKLTIDDNNYNMIYLKKVINYMLNNPKFQMEASRKKNLTNKLLLAADNLKRIKINKKEKEKKKFFLLELVNDMKDIDTSNFDKNVNSINYKYNMHVSFKDYTIEPIYKLKRFNGIDYHDLRNKHIITIDYSNNCSFDDAFSAEVLPNGNYLVGVYISDVSSYIKAGTYLDMEAYARGRTIYLSDNVIPMFPEGLTHDNFSLKQNNNRLAIAYLFEFSNDMNLVDYKIMRSLINVNKNLSYSNVNRILNEGKDIKDLQTLSNILKITEKLRQDNESKTIYHELKQIRRRAIALDDRIYDGSIGAQIVEELMVLVNHFTAYTFFESNLPFIYRINQSKYNDEEIQKLKENWNDNTQIEKIINCIKNIYEPSKYSVNNVGHHGLNLCAYGHTTNPIRCYVSLVNQRLVKKFLIDDFQISDRYYYKLEERLNVITNYINKKNELNEDYAREYEKILKKKYKNN